MNVYDYARGREDGQWVRLFDAEFQAALPPDGKPGFEAEILDLTTGKTWRCRNTYAAYETLPRYEEGNDWAGDSTPCLHPYFYGGHWCGCHRIGDIENANPGAVIETGPDESDKCPSGRFYVLRMWHASRPDVTLYWEEVPGRPDLAPEGWEGDG